MKEYLWEENEFYNDIRTRIEDLWKYVNTGNMVFDEKEQKWKQKSAIGKCSFVSYLQNEFLCWDVTDRGVGIIPMIYDIRSYFDISAIVTTETKTYDLRNEEQEFYFAPGKAERVYHLPEGCISFIFTLPIGAAFAQIKIESRSDCNIFSVSPYFLICAQQINVSTNGFTAKMKHVQILDETVSRNNSVTADPLRSVKGKTGELEIQTELQIEHTEYLNADIDTSTDNETSTNTDIKIETSIDKEKNTNTEVLLVCDRALPAGDFLRVFMSKFERNHAIQIKILERSSVDETDSDCKDRTSKDNNSKNKNDKENYCKKSNCKKSDYKDWEEVLGNVHFRCSENKKLEHQFRYSLHNSLFSRTLTEQNETMFIHGRPDHGYGDCSKIHQSYQMYFPALLVGEYESVKSELRAFSILMEADGELSFQLKVGGGKHHYDGPYSNAHYIMGIYRYLSMSGDFPFLEEVIVCQSDGKEKTILSCLLLAAEWLQKRKTKEGVMKPCGWLDAWPPTVTAQAQISFTVYHAFSKLTEILVYCNHEQAAFYEKEMKELEVNIKKIFYDNKMKIYAEHLFQDGSVRGADIEDFWVHTQIWANISQIENDKLPLKLCQQHCLKDGMTVMPESAILTDYITSSTDGLSDLNVGSTATWLLAAWPELTNLFALCCVRAGDYELAYQAVCSQLPEQLYEKYKTAAPFYYAEKYLYPYGLPWLCTWAGDPTLIEYIVEGLFGVQFTLENFTVSPMIPKSFLNKELFLKFLWRGKVIEVSTDKEGRSITH